MPTKLFPISDTVELNSLPTGDLSRDLAVLKQAGEHIAQQIKQANAENKGGMINNYYTFAEGQGDQDIQLVANKARLVHENVKQTLNTYAAKGENERQGANTLLKEWEKFFSAFDNKQNYSQRNLDRSSSSVSLDGHKLSELPPTTLQLPTLTNLNLDNNRFTTFPKELVDSPNISRVSLRGNPLESLDHVIDFAQTRKTDPVWGNSTKNCEIEIDHPTSIATLRSGELEKFQTAFDTAAEQPSPHGFQRPTTRPTDSALDSSSSRPLLTSAEQSLDDAYNKIHQHRANRVSEINELVGVPGGRGQHQIEALFTYQSQSADGTVKTEEVYIHAHGDPYSPRSTPTLSIDCHDENVKHALESALLSPSRADIEAAREARVEEIASNRSETRYRFGGDARISPKEMQEIRNIVANEPPITSIGMSALHDRLKAGNLAERYTHALNPQQARKQEINTDVGASRTDQGQESPSYTFQRQSLDDDVSIKSTLPPYRESAPSIASFQRQNNEPSLWARIITTITNWIANRLGFATENNSSNVALQRSATERSESLSSTFFSDEKSTQSRTQDQSRELSPNTFSLPRIDAANLSPSPALTNKYTIRSDTDSNARTPVKVYINKDTGKESFRVKNNGIEITNPSQETINSALDLLKGNGRKEFTVSGSPEFKAMTYIAAEKANMVANGLTAEDMKLVASMKAAQAQKDAQRQGTQNTTTATATATASQSAPPTEQKKKLLLADQIPRKLIDAPAEALVNNPKTSGKDQVFTIQKIEGDIVTLTPKFDSTRLQFELQSKGPYRVDLSKPSEAAAQIKNAIHQNQLKAGEQFTIQKDGIRKGDTTSAQRSNSQSHSR